MFDISPRHRALFDGPVGREVSAMCYGRLNFRPEPSRLLAKRHVVTPWDESAMLPEVAEPKAVRELRRAVTTRPVYSDRIAAMIAARDARTR